MDIVVTERGQIIPDGGEFPVETSATALQLQYLRTALINAIDEETIPINRIIQVRNPEDLGAAEIEIRQRIIDIIINSPFGLDFEENRISVEITQPTEEGEMDVRVTYSSETEEGEDVVANFRIEGGDLILQNPSFVFPELDFELTALSEEILIEEPTDAIPLATEADQPIFILESNSRLQERTITTDVSDISQNVRRTAVVARSQDAVPIVLGQQDPSDTDEPVDTIFLKDIVEDIVGDSFITTVEDLKGNINSISFIEEMEDHVIEVNLGDTKIEIRFTYGKPVARATATIVDRGISLDEALIPFPASDNQVPKIIFLDKVLEPGLYTIFYTGGGKREYNASMWRT